MFSCNCTEDHWSGEFCEVYDYCADEPCQNNATCTTTTTTSDYTCNCTGTGFTGEVCDVDVDDCSSNACYVNGTSSCFDLGVNLYECKCFTGFSGDYCEVDNNIYTVDNNTINNNNNNNTNVTTVPVVDTTFCASSPCVTTTALCVNDTCDCRGLNTGEFCEIGVPSEIVLLVVIPLDAFESTDDVLASLPVLLASETGLLEEQFEVVLLDASSGSYEVTVLTFNAEETYEEALSELDFMEAVSAAVPGTQVYVQDTQYVEALPAMAGHVVHAYLLIATSSIIAASLQL
jgi:hypothetical protein